MMMYAFVVAVVALFAAPAAAQNPTPPVFCALGNWTVDVDFYGYVDCDVPNDPQDPSQLVGDPDGFCTGVQYSVSGNKPIAQAAVLAYNPAFLYDGLYVKAIAGPSSSNVVNDPCVGDSSTNSGVGSCHENAIRYNPEDVADGPFWFVVEGRREFSATTLTLKSNKLDRCEILGVGDFVEENVLPDGCVPSCGGFDEDQSLIKTEIIDFKGCKARFEYNLLSGAVLNFGAACDTSLFPTVDYTNCCAENPNDPFCNGDPNLVCEFPTYNAEDGNVQVELDGIDHPVNFGDGLWSIGQDSCSCRVIGGRIYCWGQNCPEYN
jgi:hypothetical protein